MQPELSGSSITIKATIGIAQRRVIISCNVNNLCSKRAQRTCGLGRGESSNERAVLKAFPGPANYIYSTTEGHGHDSAPPQLLLCSPLQLQVHELQIRVAALSNVPCRLCVLDVIRRLRFKLLNKHFYYRTQAAIPNENSF